MVFSRSTYMNIHIYKNNNKKKLHSHNQQKIIIIKNCLALKISSSSGERMIWQKATTAIIATPQQILHKINDLSKVIQDTFCYCCFWLKLLEK